MSEDTKVPETPIDPMIAKLKEFGVSDDIATKIKDNLGAETVDDLAGVTEADLVEAGLKKLQARKVVAALQALKAPAADVHSPALNAVSFDAVLPTVPSDSSWLEALKLGGVLKVDQSTVISAVRAALAHKVGLFKIPDILVEKIESFADANEEQVDSEFYKLRKQLTRRSYAEIFSAIDGMDGSFVTESRKKQLLSRIDEKLWPAIVEFFVQLDAWQKAWMQGAANPAMMMNAFLAASGGVSIMPPGMMQPPDTGTLRDHADAVSDAVNRVFAGTGVQIAAALAYDATRIKETLSNPRLPALIGAANRDQMLKMIGVGVSATYPRLETNLTRFVLATMQVKDQPAGNEELQYFGMLYMLGTQIAWDQLSGRGLTGIGGKRL